MIEVEVINDDLESAIRTLKKRVQSSHLLKEFRFKEFFLTRRQKRRLKDALVLKRTKRRERARLQYERKEL